MCCVSIFVARCSSDSLLYDNAFLIYLPQGQKDGFHYIRLSVLIDISSGIDQITRGFVKQCILIWINIILKALRRDIINSFGNSESTSLDVLSALFSKFTAWKV